ncbi:MAG: YqgE/AlgH family protein [Methylotenera sp.]|nr:MAG: YqgE/AlgH family protein [Methylotenera sp.]
MTLENINLTGHFLIAMPALNDPYFSKSVTFICTHSEDGAMGVVINRPTDLTYDALFEKINLELNNTELAQKPVLYGGPVQPDRGFVLHEPDGIEWDSSITIAENTALTTSKDILEAVAQGTGPEKMLLTLGYAGWTPGQLEQEIAQNSWLSVQPKDISSLHDILYNTQHEKKLDATMALLGINFGMLSDEAGHA